MRISDWSSDVCSSDLRDARIAAKLPDARDAGQHLAADRAVAGELPRRLHPADAPFAETPLRQIVRSVRPPSAAQQKRPFAAAVTPERNGLARQPPVQLGRASCRERGCHYG